MLEMLQTFIANTGFAMIDYRQIIVIAIACVFLYLAIAKGYEPYLLIPTL